MPIWIRSSFTFLEVPVSVNFVQAVAADLHGIIVIAAFFYQRQRD